MWRFQPVKCSCLRKRYLLNVILISPTHFKVLRYNWFGVFVHAAKTTARGRVFKDSESKTTIFKILLQLLLQDGQFDWPVWSLDWLVNGFVVKHPVQNHFSLANRGKLRDLVTDLFQSARRHHLALFDEVSGHLGCDHACDPCWSNHS